MSILEKIKTRFQAWKQQRMERTKVAREARLEEEARMAVQIMEYNGRVYICVYGIPLFGNEGADQVNLVDLVSFLSHARSNYKHWAERKMNR